MKSLRLASSLLLATTLCAASGCRTAGVGDLSRQERLPTRSTESAADLLVEHNRNAELVRSLEATPGVTGANRGKHLPGAGGNLALELPRKFRLQVTAGMSGQEIADIGSNDQEFWFWFKDSPDKAVVYCNYDGDGASPLAVGLQPDWIIEALGLRVIPEEEAAGIEVTPGKDPTKKVLTQRVRNPRGDSLFKEMTFDLATRRVVEYQVYQADHKTRVARVAISEFDDFPVPATSGEPAARVFLPRKLRLEMIQEKMALNVVLSAVKVNRLDASQRIGLFSEPKKGVGRKDLAELIGVSTAPTSVRETMPAPPPRVRLNEPAPLGIDGALRTERDPAALAADLPPSYARGVADVVGPNIPTINDPLPRGARTPEGWRRALSAGIER